MAPTGSDKTARNSRYDWVDMAKGICILAVVGLYARNELAQTLGHAGWLDPWSTFARPFRMPDFFLLSGLFLSSVIDRPWRHYLDTKVAHYLYFLLLWVPILATFDLLVRGTQAPAGPGLGLLIKFYAWKLLYPDHMLWFLQTLPVCFVVTRLLRNVPRLLLWLVAAAALVAQVRTGFAPADNFIAYYAFFLAGHFAAPWIFAGADLAARHRAATLLLFVAWCFFNQWAVSLGRHGLVPGGDLLLGFLGIAAIISLSSLLASIPALAWLRQVGSHSIVIYLGFYIPLMLFLHGVSTLGVDVNLLATLAVVVGAASPLLIFSLVKGTALRFVFVRPAWSHLVPPRRKPVPSVMTDTRTSPDAGPRASE